VKIGHAKKTSNMDMGPTKDSRIRNRRAFLINVTFASKVKRVSVKGSTLSPDTKAQALLGLAIVYPFFLKPFLRHGVPAAASRQRRRGMKINSFRLNRIKV